MTTQTNPTGVGGCQPDKLCPKCAKPMGIRAVAGNIATGETTTELACPNCAYSETSTNFDEAKWWVWFMDLGNEV